MYYNKLLLLYYVFIYCVDLIICFHDYIFLIYKILNNIINLKYIPIYIFEKL